MTPNVYRDGEDNIIPPLPTHPETTPAGSEIARWTFAACYKILSGEKTQEEIAVFMKTKFPNAGFGVGSE